LEAENVNDPIRQRKVAPKVEKTGRGRSAGKSVDVLPTRSLTPAVLGAQIASRGTIRRET